MEDKIVLKMYSLKKVIKYLLPVYSNNNLYSKYYNTVTY